jgi:uncharacterized MAPEG superfamily protein
MALLLTLIQVAALPLMFNIKNLDYLLRNRDDTADESITCGRARRAANNLLESLAAFLALGILSVLKNVDNTDLMLYWLVIRVAYAISYILGITHLRTVLWFGSIICLIMMALALI